MDVEAPVAAVPDIGGVVSVLRVTHRAEDLHLPTVHKYASYLIWDAQAAIRLRGVGRLAITPVGMCPLKLHSKGKAAALPIILSHEELYTAHRNGWVRVADAATHAEVDVDAELDAEVRVDARLGVKRLVFYDLWRHGYRCTNGIKFGVDYLAYTDDPAVVHAAFMIIAAEEGALIAPLDLVGRARVATTALKTCVLAYANVAEQSVRYEAFKRIGPGGSVFECASALLPSVLEAERAARVSAAPLGTAALAAAEPSPDVEEPGVEFMDATTLFGANR